MWRYWRGNVPWDSGIVPPEIIAWTDGKPTGRALDLGCGTGTTALYLAARGWQVVGVDFVPQAIRQAQRKAQKASSGGATFHIADVSRLDFVEPPFDLVIDIGCLHGLDAAQRERYAAHVIRLMRAGATFLLYAFLPDANCPALGIDRAELTTRFGSAFNILHAAVGQDTTNSAASGWYTLRRTEHT